MSIARQATYLWQLGVLLPCILFFPVVVQAEAVPLAERLLLCSGCHNPDGNSIIPENPRLSGLDAGYLTRQMADFKSGKRKSVTMGAIISMIDEKEFSSLAEFFSTQKPAKVAVVDAKLTLPGKVIFDEGISGSAVAACSSCHNEDGSGNEKYPRIAGQHVPYVIDELLKFKSGERDNDVKAAMRAVAKRMNEKEIRSVADYIATLTGGE